MTQEENREAILKMMSNNDHLGKNVQVLLPETKDHLPGIHIVCEAFHNTEMEFIENLGYSFEGIHMYCDSTTEFAVHFDNKKE